MYSNFELLADKIKDRVKNNGSKTLHIKNSQAYNFKNPEEFVSWSRDYCVSKIQKHSPLDFLFLRKRQNQAWAFKSAHEGHALNARKETNAAMAKYQAALELDHESVESLVGRASMYIKTFPTYNSLIESQDTDNVLLQNKLDVGIENLETATTNRYGTNATQLKRGLRWQ